MPIVTWYGMMEDSRLHYDLAKPYATQDGSVGQQLTGRVRGVVVYQTGDDSIQTHHSLVRPSVQLFFSSSPLLFYIVPFFSFFLILVFL